MLEQYDEIFKELKDYLESQSIYQPRVVKNKTNKSADFPIVVCQLSNITDTDNCTIDKIECFKEMYLTNDVYTTNKVINEEEISSQVINNELTNLIIKFFEYKNMKMTLCRLTPNLDTNVLRRTIQHQGLISTSRKNIIRR